MDCNSSESEAENTPPEVRKQAAGCVPWADPSQEILDELNDAEIYKAVVKSVSEWQRRQNIKKSNGRTKREEARACYPSLGCFEASGPFGYLDTLPASPEEVGTRFLLYPGHSRRRSGAAPADVPFSELEEAFTWSDQGFNGSLHTKVLIHGFGSDCSHVWIYEMRSALMAVEEVNVICVDWQNGAILPNYVKATANTRLVGKQLALLLRGLVARGALSLRRTHLIGFSLGAHVAGFAGAETGNVSRITGLDPAGPLFESQDPRARLDQTDADFVDVIHSNGENLILGGLGSYQPMGHVDFYPNGGRMQKGCSNLFVGAVSDIIWSSTVEGRSLCNHRRAYKFFTDSVSPRCHFPAFPCGSYEDFLAGKCFPCNDERQCGNMGYYADRSKGKGQLYLVTRDEEPFCAHQYHVKIETSPSDTPIVSYGKIQITLMGDSGLNETFMMTRKEDEEMKLGDSISRILVPHPILSEPTRIQILYTAYSGWLSSGLTQWRMDKVTLGDSFGKMSSVCRKNLILDSGVPITLPLYPGECNLPNESAKEAEDRHDTNAKTPQKLLNAPPSKEYNTFIPTPVVKSGPESEQEYKNSLSFSEAINFLNLPWRNDKDNSLSGDETETSRAFNTRIIKATDENRDKADADGLIREIVEPILKPQSSKNARSHNPDKEKPEISEPILGPTTSKTMSKTEPFFKNDFFSRITNNDNKEITYNFFDVDYTEEWLPTQTKKPGKENKRKRQDESRVLTGFEVPKSDNPLEAIVTTVQFLPQRLSRMFEQAEKYARETILPLVSTYTPKFISDIWAPRETPKYLPLVYEESSPTPKLRSKSKKISRRIDNNFIVNATKVNNSNDSTQETKETTTELENVDTITNEIGDGKATTPYSHIQRIKKSNHEVKFIFPTTVAKVVKSNETTTNSTETDKIRKARHDVSPKKEKSSRKKSSRKIPKAIYIDLPVFEQEPHAIKYIPLSHHKDPD